MTLKRRLIAIAIVLCITLLFTSCHGVKTSSKSGTPNTNELRVVFINVGKADAILVSFEESNYLIDTGSRDSLPRLIKALKTLNVVKLDGIFITHAHKDHIGGLEGLLELVDVNVIYVHKITDFDNKDGKNEVAELASRYNIHFNELNTGDDVFISEKNKDIKFTVMGPVIKNNDNENDNSLVMQIKHQGQYILFAGDMQYAEEKTLLDANLLRKYNVLKVGNHGNNDATSLEFAKVVLPDIAIFTTDKDILADGLSTKAVDNLRSVNAELYSIRDSNMGVQLQITKDEINISNQDFATSEVNSSIEIADIDHVSELVTLQNSGNESIDLSGWWMVSDKGNEVFYFPKGTTIEANGDLLIASGDYQGRSDLYWNDKNVWKDNKADKALLYDSNGNLVDSFDTPGGGD